MILKSLYDYAHTVADKIPERGIELKEIAYVIVIDRTGKFVRFESKRINKTKCQSFPVARTANRSSNEEANILWDNGKYVFGFEKDHESNHNLFLGIIDKIAERHPYDLSILALSKYYQTPTEELQAMMRLDPLYEEVMNSMSVNFSFRMEEDDILIAEKNHLFKDLINLYGENPVIGRCLVTGVSAPIARITTPTPLPGNSPKAALVSFQKNSGYDSYGKTQAYNAPISVDAEADIAAALKKLLGKDSTNKARIGNRMFVFWGSKQDSVDKEVEQGMSFLLDIPDKKATDPDEKVGKVTKLFKSIYSGQIKTTLDDRFYILGLAPNTGRIAVVFWSDTTLKQFAGKIEKHFRDMQIIDTRKPESRRNYFGVFSMISAVTLGGKLSDALPNLAESVTEAIVNDSLYPMQLLYSAIERIKAELNDRTVSIERAAIIKAFINRKTRNSNINKPLEIMLDKSNTNQGYLCGRLTAVLEKIQKDSGSGDSIRTRYMASASSTPSVVFPAMLNVSVHHSEKLPDKSRIFFEQLKQEIMDKLPASGFPSHLDISDQGRFFVGYYHQRADLYTKKETGEQPID